MLLIGIFLLTTSSAILGQPVAETAEDCLDYVEVRLKVLLATDVSVRDSMCEMLQDFAQCVYKSSQRKMSAAENAKFIRMVELALKNSGESGKVCEIDVDGVTGGGKNMTEKEQEITDEAVVKIEKCISHFSDQIVRVMNLNATIACQLLDYTLLCILTAIPRRPTASEIATVESVMSAALPTEMRSNCKVDLNEMVRAQWWTAEDCMEDAEKSFQNLLAMDDSTSVQDSVCDIWEDLIKCVRLTEQRELTNDEDAAVLRLAENVMANTGETATICGRIIFNITAGNGEDDGSIENTTDPSVAETATATGENCINDIKNQLISVLATGDSVSDIMCDLNQIHAKCVYMSEHRSRSSEESYEFIKLIENALMRTREAGRVCELDWDAIKNEEDGGDDQFTKDPSIAGETAQDCTNDLKNRLKSLQDEGYSISDNMCDLNQEHARCVYMAEERRRNDEETREFVTLVENALRQAGETGKPCEVDMDAIMGGEEETKVLNCTEQFSRSVNAMAVRGAAVREEEYCKVKNEVIQCVLDALNRRPAPAEVSKYAELLKASEQQAGLKCDIDLNAAIEEYLKKKAEEENKGGENGGIGVMYRGSTLIWLVVVSVIAHSLVKMRFN